MAKRTKKIKRGTAAATQVPLKAKRPPDWPVVALAGVGMAVTAYLTGVHWWDGSPAFCEVGSSCDVIQQSRWSTVLGLPLALWGFLTYALIGLIAYRPLVPAKRWTWLWRISVVGLAISLYLTLAGIIALQAVCIWCLISLAVIAGIFTLLLLQRPPAAPGTPWWNLPLNSTVLAIVVVTLLHLYYNSDLLSPPPDPRLEALAVHLNETGARYYGASWCVSCQRQTRMFRDAGDELPYVECSPFGQGGVLASACAAADIRSFPTWIIDDERFEGVLEPEELARRSGFDWEAAAR